jgi:hypothetical protein
MITGTIFFRHKGAAIDKSGRKLIMVLALIAVDENSKIPNEATCPLYGGELKHGLTDANLLQLTIGLDESKDSSSVTEGMGPATIFREPIWRI